MARPKFSKIIGRNIRTLVQFRVRASGERSAHEQAALAITSFVGSIPCVYLHLAWFGSWMAVNTFSLGVHHFDPFPYAFLANIVSFEAVLLTTLVLITQNRLSAEAEHRANLDLHVGLLAEHELTRALRMLHAIQEKLGIEHPQPEELADLEIETRPEDVLAEITRLHRSGLGRTPAV